MMTTNRHIVASDLVLGAFLCLVIVVFALTPASRSATFLHSAMLIAFVGAIAVTAANASSWWAPWLRSIATVAVILTLYTTLSEPSFDAMGGARDAFLAKLERWTFMGNEPVLAVAPKVTPGIVEFFSFVYGWFIPYVYLSIFLGCFGRPEAERRSFLFGLALTYSISYLGYLFIPARGPILFYEFAQELEGGFFHGLVVRGVDSLGGPHGAFPSLHVGAMTYLTLFDLVHNRLRGMTYVPVLLLIMIATIVLRYHYAIDLIAGFAIAAFSLFLAERSRKTSIPGVV